MKSFLLLLTAFFTSNFKERRDLAISPHLRLGEPSSTTTSLPEEDRTPNTHPIVVIGHGLWQRRFGGDPNVIGRTVTLNEHDFTVIGVAPREFGSTISGAALDAWTPVMMIEGYTPGRDEDMRINYETIGPNYFQTMGIQLARGRDFNERDNERAPSVVVISEAMTCRFWPEMDAMGQRLKIGKDWLEIVSVARNVKQRRLNEPPQPYPA